MDIFLQQLVNSLSMASVIILIGIGITIIFGLTGIINFAHGEFLMVGGMMTWLVVGRHVNFFLALAIVGGRGGGARAGARARHLPLHARAAR